MVVASVLNADVTDMVKNGTVEGEFRTFYSGIDNKNDTDVFATAVGGRLFYKLASYNNFGGGVEFTTSQDINFLSGDDGHRNTNLSSKDGSYTTVSQVYLSYEKDAFKVVAGRQNLDVPFADGDDVRIVSNSFEAYTLAYEKDSLSFLGGFVTSWQGTDAGLDNGWSAVGKNGMGFGGISYEDDIYSLSGWVFDVDGTKDDEVANTTYYVDGSYALTENLTLSAQYLKQVEKDSSGVEATIFGLMAEVETNDVIFSLAYNNSLKEDAKQSFSGFGGGTLFTSMDSEILDNITKDRGAYAICATAGYSYHNFGFGYAYGDFNGNNNSANEQAHVVEQDLMVEYLFSDNASIETTMVMVDDRESTNEDSNNLRVKFSYNF